MEDIEHVGFKKQWDWNSVKERPKHMESGIFVDALGGPQYLVGIYNASEEMVYDMNNSLNKTHIDGFHMWHTFVPYLKRSK